MDKIEAFCKNKFVHILKKKETKFNCGNQLTKTDIILFQIFN